MGGPKIEIEMGSCPEMVLRYWVVNPRWREVIPKLKNVVNQGFLWIETLSYDV